MATDLGKVIYVPCSTTSFLWDLAHTQVQLQCLLEYHWYSQTLYKIHPKLQASFPPKAWHSLGPCLQNHPSTDTIPDLKTGQALMKTRGLFPLQNTPFGQDKEDNSWSKPFSIDVLRLRHKMVFLQAHFPVYLPLQSFFCILILCVTLPSSTLAITTGDWISGFKNAWNSLSSLCVREQDNFPLPLPSPTEGQACTYWNIFIQCTLVVKKKSIESLFLQKGQNNHMHFSIYVYHHGSGNKANNMAAFMVQYTHLS